MASFDLNTLNSALENSEAIPSGVDFSGKSLKLDSAKDAQPIVDAISKCPNLQYLTLTGNTLGVPAAEAISKALAAHPELKICRFSDMFTGRMKTEIPPALSALGEGMIAAGARLSVLDLSDNAFGPIGVEGLAKLLESDVCSELEELRLNNNGLGITGGELLASALAARPRQLKIFVAGRNRLENDGATALAKVFETMGTLEEVAMPQNGIYHEGVSALSDAFKHNPRLSRLNLNDNTVGVEGANAMAQVMPKLKNLKSVNFGDCLLKSKGAIALANAFKENGIFIESVDLSFNEIGHKACMEVVDALTVLPNSRERLTRVVLAGNSLGNATHKNKMLDKLGACAELSDDEGSDNEFMTDSESDDGLECSEDSDNDNDVSVGDYSNFSNFLDMTADTSSGGEAALDVSTFLKEPSVENLRGLGPNAAEVIDTHLQWIMDPNECIAAYVEATLLVCGTREWMVARAMFPQLFSVTNARPAMQWVLIDNMLRGLQLIKSEDRNYKIRWSLPECFSVLASVINAPYFSQTLRDTLRLFICSKLSTLPPEIKEVVDNNPSLRRQS